MLFSKDIPPRCEYCRFGKPNGNGDSVACSKRGTKNPWDKCFRYKYDPLKRIPEAPVNYIPKEYSEDEFTL